MAFKILKLIAVNTWIIAALIIGIELGTRIQHGAKIMAVNKRFDPTILWSSLQNKGGPLEGDFKRSNEQRYPYPYQMFKGKPNALDHNEHGYRFKASKNQNSIKFAFFGGSTGYGGEPPIAQLLAQKLTRQHGKSFEALNFSVVSSNHNQHIHSLVDNHSYYDFDFVIFYGGFNETVGYLQYPADNRPGYPYNFHIRNEAPPEFTFLFKHSRAFRNVAESQGLINRFLINKKYKPYRRRWYELLTKNYFSTLKKAEILSVALTQNKCQAKFIGIHQPYNYKLIPNNFEYHVYSKIKNHVKTLKNIIDVSDSIAPNSDFYTDAVHLTQEGREKVADAIFSSPDFQKIASSCINRT